MAVGFISLGCSKNLVDTEMMIGLFKKHGYTIVNDAKEAEIIIINTCGFIKEAKEEAINTILEMAEYKKNGKCKYLIATGCLVERYREELIKEIGEVDLFIKFSEYENFWDQLSKTIEKREDESKLDFLDREITTGEDYAYIRVAEGCDNFCTFCAIPYIRGRFRSRKIEDIVLEAKKLADKGIKELIVVAQDTSRYGLDIYGKLMLSELIHQLSEIEGIEWIRFLYTYPENITDELIKEVKENDKVCKYFDIPIQHISNNMLKAMNRKTTKEDIVNLVKKLRKEIPGVTIRSTVMVGFPGETEEDFNELYDFVKETKFDKLGCFMYSKEEGTVAEKLKNQIPQKIKSIRFNAIMEEQQKISREALESNVGKTLKVLATSETLGRTSKDAPDIDGVVFFDKKVTPHKFVNCKITKVKNYDLIGEVED